jgi:hypothetical protein
MWDLIWKFVTDHNGALGLMVALGTAIAALHNYFSIKRSEERARKFSNFHQLLQDLNEGKPKPNGDTGGQYIDRQQAIIYELRSFKEYHPVIIRVLNRGVVTWSESDTPHMSDLIDEANMTMSFIIRNNSLKAKRRI